MYTLTIEWTGNKITALKDLYIRRNNWAAHKQTIEAYEFSDANPTHAVYEQRDALKAELKAITARLTHEINQLNVQIMAQGLPTSNTDRRRELDMRLRGQRKELDNEFLAEVHASSQRGMSVNDMVMECGAPHGAPFYAALKSTRATVDGTPLVEQTPKEDIKWEGSTHRGVHRIFISEDGRFVRYHAVDLDSPSHVVLTSSDYNYYAGDRELAERFDATRVDMLRSILDGTYSGPVRVGDNPYAGELDTVK